MKQEKRYLIVNADGYGFTPGVNKGIVETFESGMVSSTSCTPNFGFLDEAYLVQKKFPNISFGIHFNLNVGKPLSNPNKIRSLLDENEEFLGNKLETKILKGQVKYSEILTELKAQASILADQSIKISHFDGHQNKHLWPRYFEACLEVAKYFDIKGIRSHRRHLYKRSGALSYKDLITFYSRNPQRTITHLGGRIRTFMAELNGLNAADRLITPGYSDNSHKTLTNFWKNLAVTMPSGVSEIYCHPGYPDEILRNNAYYVEERLEETKVLKKPELKELFESQNISIINFWELHKIKKDIA